MSSPETARPAGTTWAWAGFALVALTCVAGLVVLEQVADLVRDASAGRPRLGTVLGWLPVGGLSTWVAALLVVRARRADPRWPDRLLAGVALVWLGVTLSLLPVRPGGSTWSPEMLGPDAVHALRGSVVALGGVVVLGLALGAWRFRGHGPGDLPPRPEQLRWAAASLAPPALVVLVVLLLT